LVALLIVAPLVAFGMWLAFNALMVKWHGLDALRVTPAIYRVFRPGEWSGPPKTDDNEVAAQRDNG
jgi:hypothetical protein